MTRKYVAVNGPPAALRATGPDRRAQEIVAATPAKRTRKAAHVAPAGATPAALRTQQGQAKLQELVRFWKPATLAEAGLIQWLALALLDGDHRAALELRDGLLATQQHRATAARREAQERLAAAAQLYSDAAACTFAEAVKALQERGDA